jgi:hypothetical protein
MKFENYFSDASQHESEVIAFFGQAKLVRTIDYKYELRGGTHDDRTSAREYISLFFHNAAVKEISA